MNLAALEGTEIVYLARFPVERILTLNIEIGSRLPAFSASLGRAMLAYLPPEEAMTILRNSDRRAFTPNTKTEIPDLIAVLEQVRRRGFALVARNSSSGCARWPARSCCTRAGRSPRSTYRCPPPGSRPPS